jgi:small-conductance mechanosensitive channel
MLLVVIAALGLNLLLSSLAKRIKTRVGDVSGFNKKLFMVIKLITWVVAGGIILLILDKPFSEALEYKIVDGENFTLEPVHFFLAAFIIVGTRILLMGMEKLFGIDSLITPGDSSKKKNALKFFSYIIWLAAILMILGLTGLKLTVLWGAGAALLVGIGFGLQQIFADLISGLFLLFEGNLREKDVVELNNGTVGKVQYIGARTSKIKTRDDVVMIIPNSQFISHEVINWSHIESKTRFSVGVGVAYGSDVQLVKNVLLECAGDYKRISAKPKPFVRFQDFGDSSLDFSLYFWTGHTFEVENIKSDIRFMIEEKFRDNDIQIPFPQRDVHMIP